MQHRENSRKEIVVFNIVSLCLSYNMLILIENGTFVYKSYIDYWEATGHVLSKKVSGDTFLNYLTHYLPYLTP